MECLFSTHAVSFDPTCTMYHDHITESERKKVEKPKKLDISTIPIITFRKKILEWSKIMNDFSESHFFQVSLSNFKNNISNYSNIILAVIWSITHTSQISICFFQYTQNRKRLLRPTFFSWVQNLCVSYTFVKSFGAKPELFSKEFMITATQSNSGTTVR